MKEEMAENVLRMAVRLIVQELNPDAVLILARKDGEYHVSSGGDMKGWQSMALRLAARVADDLDEKITALEEKL